MSLTDSPFNVQVMNVDQFIKDHRIQPVSSLMIREPSSTMFHPDGLFSERIFGEIGTDARLTTLGYIELNTPIIAPVIYRTIVSMSKLYDDIMAGMAYAVFNDTTKMFERVSGDPEDHPEARTGMSFFLEHFHELKFSDTGSVSRDTKIELVDKYRNVALYTKYLVEPAGLRDIPLDTPKLIQDDVNKLYTSLIAYTLSIPPRAVSPIYDSVRYRIQTACNGIYEYINNILTGKTGFFQGAYASRRVAMGTRNVITAVSYNAARPDDPQFLKQNETLMGLFQTMKACQPLVFHAIKTLLLNPVFGETGSSTIPLIDRKTLQLQYVDITENERQTFTSSDGINRWINRFRNNDVKSLPITVKSKTNESYYLCLVYDTGSVIRLCRSIDDIKASLGPAFNAKYLRPLTWVEAFYLVTANIVADKHVFVTRYPVLGDESCYPSKVHLRCTTPSRIVELEDLINPGYGTVQYPEYPVLGNPFFDACSPSSTKIAGLGADFDGDTVSTNMVLTEDANIEVHNYLTSTKSMINSQKRLISGSATDLVELVYANLSRNP